MIQNSSFSFSILAVVIHFLLAYIVSIGKFVVILVSLYIIHSFSSPLLLLLVRLFISGFQQWYYNSLSMFSLFLSCLWFIELLKPVSLYFSPIFKKIPSHLNILLHCHPGTQSRSLRLCFFFFFFFSFCFILGRLCFFIITS